MKEWKKARELLLTTFLFIEWERDQFVVPWINAFIGWFFLYVPWPGINPWFIHLTNWATCPGLGNIHKHTCMFLLALAELSKQQLMSISFPVIRDSLSSTGPVKSYLHPKLIFVSMLGVSSKGVYIKMASVGHPTYSFPAFLPLSKSDPAATLQKWLPPFWVVDRLVWDSRWGWNIMCEFQTFIWIMTTQVTI